MVSTCVNLDGLELLLALTSNEIVDTLFIELNRVNVKLTHVIDSMLLQRPPGVWSFLQQRLAPEQYLLGHLVDIRLARHSDGDLQVHRVT